MTTSSKNKGLLFLFTILAVMIMIWSLWATGYRINTTASLPRGIYRLAKGDPQRGDVVSFCLPTSWESLSLERGYVGIGTCPEGGRPLLKRLAGVPGDLLSLTDDGLRINGTLWPDSIPAIADRMGRPVPIFIEHGDHLIPEGLALVLGLHPGSWDSRYFGLVSLDSLHLVQPILTDERG